MLPTERCLPRESTDLCHLLYNHRTAVVHENAIIRYYMARNLPHGLATKHLEYLAARNMMIGPLPPQVRVLWI